MKYKRFLLLLLIGNVAAFAQKPVLSVVDSNAVKTLFFAGLRDKLNENYASASESFNKILILDPDNAAVHYEIAMLNYRQNKLQEAEFAIKKAVELDKENIWYWKLLAELYKRKGNMDALIDVFNQLIRLSPDNDSYYFDRSNAYLLAGNTEEAIKGYDELEQKFGVSNELIQARQRINMDRDGELSKQEVEKLLAEEAGDVKNILFTSGLLMDKGQHQEALLLLKKAKVTEPDNFEVDLAIADVYKSLKNSGEAKAALESAFVSKMMPADQKVKIVMLLFAGAKNEQRVKDAAELAQLAVKVHPDDPKVIALYGDLLYKQGNFDGALEQYRSVLNITDELYAVWEQVLNIEIGKGLYAAAIKTADEALSVYPNQAVLYYYMAIALCEENQIDEALKNIKTALQLDSENTAYTEYYGDLLFLKGEQALALVQWKKAKNAGNDSEKLNRKINERKYIK